MTVLRAEGVTVVAGQKALVRGASVSVSGGELVAVLGPNGAGKTTLLRALAGLIAPDAGTVTLDGMPVRALRAAARARRVAYLPQERPLAWPSPVRDVVALGRYAYGAAPGRLGAEDAAAVAEAIDACDLAPLAHRPTDTLSGGEIARVHIARALAARTALLLADEPVAALDPRHQLRVAGQIRRYVEAGGGALIVMHDIELAARIADRLVFLRNGAIVADGPAANILTADLVARVYDVCATVTVESRGIDVRIEGVL
ncbi:MAG TPA: ABC transporter ATP-binding protein [Woeseiaceae bacterium]|nr:ABC transporter ATP-binding protein [Woeseiaceae bacterium]